tara:strand:+ start:672 stop:1169 length:498 start_codon:yes stop_codon:yes gene_type:complete
MSGVDYSKYHFFWDGPFSNWHPSIFFINGTRYTFSEQYMMAEKATLFQDYDVLEKILNATTPKEHQTLGRLVRGFNRPIWDDHKFNIVYRGNLAKFSQDTNLTDTLLNTGDNELCEASPKDLIWGIGVNQRDAIKTDPENWPGQNLMGKVLMKVREAIKPPNVAP